MIIPNECRENASYTPAEPCIPPEGTIEITENGLIDVAQFANANVNVSGGGGGLELLHTESIGRVTATSTATSLDKSLVINDVNDYDLLILSITEDSASERGLVRSISSMYLYANGIDLSIRKAGITTTTPRLNVIRERASGETKLTSRQNSYGIYANSPTIDSEGNATLPLYAQSNASGTGKIDNDYTAKVYGVKLTDDLLA